MVSFNVLIQHCFIFCPSDSTMSEDAGIEPKTIVTSALAFRSSIYSARSHLQKLFGPPNPQNATFAEGPQIFKQIVRKFVDLPFAELICGLPTFENANNGGEGDWHLKKKT
jgi:hypothetical protein